MSGATKAWVFFDARWWIVRRRRRLEVLGLREERCRLAVDQLAIRRHRSHKEC